MSLKAPHFNVIVPVQVASSTEKPVVGANDQAKDAPTVNTTPESAPSSGPTSSRKRRKKRGNHWTKRRKKKSKATLPAQPSSDPLVVMSRKELREWKAWYRTPQKLEEYMRLVADDPDNLMESFHKTMARMMFSMYSASEFYDQCYLEYYQWEHRQTETLTTQDDDVDDEQENYRRVHFDNGAVLMLQIRNAEQEWQDWVYMKKSNFGDYGVFTARAFPKGAYIGLYTGPEVYRANQPGTVEPSSEELTSMGIADSIGLCSIRDPEGRILVLRPERADIDANPEPLYMGMQFVKGKEEPAVPSNVTVNCQIVDDGGVVTHMALDAHVELVCGVLDS